MFTVSFLSPLQVDKEAPDVAEVIKPVFISVDPLRDTVPRLKAHAKEYHPRIRWMTGKYDDVRHPCSIDT
jgi:protein SCO1/2